MSNLIIALYLISVLSIALKLFCIAAVLITVCILLKRLSKKLGGFFLILSLVFIILIPNEEQSREMLGIAVIQEQA